jgi:uncharacterized protein (DUF697 family)
MAFGLGTLAMVWELLRESGFAEVDASLERAVRLAVTGASPAERQAVIEALAAGSEPGLIGHDVPSPALELRLRWGGTQLLVDLITPGYQSADTLGLADLRAETIVATLGPAIIERLPLEAVGIGRRLPALRESAANHQVRAYSVLNAQLAALSNLPDLLPALGPFLAGAAELVLLTKNQLVLIYKLAAIYDRPLNDKKALLTEVLSVLGAAYLWRSLARQLAGVAPFGLGIVPKVAIAFTATYVEGKSAQYYFERQAPPPRELIGRFSEEAKALAQRWLPRLRRQRPTPPTPLPTPTAQDR